MRKIVDVHHPHLDAKLLDQVLIKFYWLREQSELRKKPSTSELVDWISALLRSGVSMDQLEAHIPFVGALLKKEQDVDALARYDERGGTLPEEVGRPGTALQPVAPPAMFLDLFYGLRDEGVPVSMQEWQTFLRRSRQGLHGSSLLRFYHLGRACLVKSETYFDAYDRVFARVFKGVEGALGDDVTERDPGVAAGPEELPRAHSRAARRARAPVVRRADAPLPRDARGADRAPRRRRPLGRHRRASRPSVTAASASRPASGSAARRRAARR